MDAKPPQSRKPSRAQATRFAYELGTRLNSPALGSEIVDPHDTQEAPATSLRSTVIRGGSLAALGLFSTQIIAFIGFLILARLAGPATFGAYAAASILIGWGALFTEAGMQAAVVQRESRLQEAASTGFLVNLVGGIILGLCAAALAPLVGLFFHSFRIGLAAMVLAGTIPITAASIVPGALMQRRLSLARILAQPFGAVAFVVTSVITLTVGFRIWGLVIATYAAAVAQTSLIWVLARWRPARGLVSWEMYKQLSRYGRAVVAGQALREFGRVGNTAVVGRVLGIGTLGEYRYAAQLVTQTSLPITFGGAYVLLPAFSRIWRDEDRFRRALLRTLRILSLVVFPISLAFFPLGDALAVILFGEKWQGAGPIMMALAGVGIAYSLDSVSSEVFKARGRTEFLPRMHGLTALVPLVLVLGLTPVMGSVGAGLAMSIGTLAVAGYAISRVGRICDIAVLDLLTQLWPAVLGASVMAGLLFIIEHAAFHADRGGGAGLALLVLEVLIGATIYLAVLRITAPSALRELMAVTKSLAVRRTRRARDVFEG